MKLLRKEDAQRDSRPDGRTVYTLHQMQVNSESAVFYLCEVPGGKFGAHYHTQSHEIIWFPGGGKIVVNGQAYEMNAWDAVLLEPGDVHGFEGHGEKDILHFAVKFPAVADKVESRQPI